MNVLLLNLAVADMMVGLFIAPRFILIHLFKHPDGVAGKVFCELLTGGNLAWFGGIASVFTLVVIAFERYYAVMYPYGNRGKLTYNKLKVLISMKTKTVDVLFHATLICGWHFCHRAPYKNSVENAKTGQLIQPLGFRSVLVHPSVGIPSSSEPLRHLLHSEMLSTVHIIPVNRSLFQPYGFPQQSLSVLFS